MERLAWFEVLNQHQEVVNRLPLYAWPVSIGRAYDCDVVLDDPYVAAHHLNIHLTDDGRYQLEDLGSLNGLYVGKNKQSTVIVAADEVAKIGQTWFRLCAADSHAIPAERPLRNTVWWQSWSGLALGSTVLLSERMLAQWLDYDREDVYNSMFLSLFDQVPYLLAWVGFWSLLSRIQTGKSQWMRHAIIASLWGGAYQLLGDMSGYIGFAFNSGLTQTLLNEVGQPLLLVLLLNGHLRLVSRMSYRKVLGFASAVVLCVVGFVDAKSYFMSENDLAKMPYISTIGPTNILLTHGKSTDQFMQEAKKLKPELDNLPNEQP